jgi:hypothetical protein
MVLDWSGGEIFRHRISCNLILQVMHVVKILVVKDRVHRDSVLIVPGQVVSYISLTALIESRLIHYHVVSYHQVSFLASRFLCVDTFPL